MRWTVEVSVKRGDGGGFTMSSGVVEGNPAFLHEQLEQEGRDLVDTVVGATLGAYGIKRREVPE